MPSKVAHSHVEVYPHLPAYVADGLAREKLEGNVTSSLADPDFANYRNTLTPEMAALLHDWNFCLNLSKGSIEQHFEKRLSHLFIQAVVCYRTGYRFREGRTIHQGLGAHHLHMPNGEIKFEAAHSPTIPCLYACSEGEEHVFLYRSGIYDEGNATVDVLKAVNEADSAIDWMDKENSLRTKTVELLNKAAKGELTPVEVTKQFALCLIETIDSAQEKTPKADVKDVLQLYRHRAELLWSYVDHPDHIDRWLNLDLEHPLLSAKTGSFILTDRTQILKFIRAKIEQLPAIIHQERHQTMNESRSPAHFYDLFYQRLFKQFEAKDIKLLEEATGMNLRALNSKAKTFQRTGTSIGILNQNAAKIEALVADLTPLLASLKGAATTPVTPLSSERKISLRPGIYRLRYQMIRADQEAQSVIKSKIESIWHQIQRTSKAAYLEVFFQWSILAHAPDEKTRQIFCKLLSISGADIEQRIQEIKVNRNAHAALEKCSWISSLASRVLQLSPQAAQIEVAQLLHRIQSSSNATSINLLFYRRLFNYADTPEKKGLMAQKLGQTEESIDRSIAALLAKKKQPQVEKSVHHQQIKIDEIMTVAKEALLKLQQSTYRFRCELMVELRQSHGMSQDYFKMVYKQQFPQFPMSDGTMSNLENDKKTIDETIIGQLSSIFGVSKTLFHPSHFADEVMR